MPSLPRWCCWGTGSSPLTIGLCTTGDALQAGVSVVGALFVGMTAGVIGGVLVALLRGMTPAVLVPGVFYAFVDLAGAGAYVAVEPGSPAIAAVSCVALGVALRITAVRW
ncbi:MAG: TRIC cation channel family protein, partial [Miltoncostaeaceae bacterium]